MPSPWLLFQWRSQRCQRLLLLLGLPCRCCRWPVCASRHQDVSRSCRAAPAPDGSGHRETAPTCNSSNCGIARCESARPTIHSQRRAARLVGCSQLGHQASQFQCSLFAGVAVRLKLLLKHPASFACLTCVSRRAEACPAYLGSGPRAAEGQPPSDAAVRSAALPQQVGSQQILEALRMQPL